MVFDLIKRMLGPGPVYSVLGNHDTGNVYVSFHSRVIECLLIKHSSYSAQDAIEALGGDLSKQYSWCVDSTTITSNAFAETIV